jgi:dihydrofolate reductase
MIIFVAAHDKNFGIGYKGGLPWPKMKNDKDRLHSLARGKTIVMGERTYHDYRDYKKTYQTEKVYVVSLNLKELKDAIVLNSLDQVIEMSASQDLWVLGGGEIFRQLLTYANKMHLTVIDAELPADTYFPKYNLSDWNVVNEQHFEADKDNPYPYTFLDLVRNI